MTRGATAGSSCGAVMLALLGSDRACSGAVAADSKLATWCEASRPRRSRSVGSATRSCYSGADVGAKARFHARERGRRRLRAHVRLRRASATTRASRPRTSRSGTQLVEHDQVFAVVPTITPDLGAVEDAHRPEGSVLRLGDLVELLRQRLRLRVHRLPVPAGRTHHEQRVGRSREDRRWRADPEPDRGVAHREHAVGPGGADQPDRRREERGNHGRGGATSSLPVPAVGRLRSGSRPAVLTANAGKPPDVVFVVGGYSNVVAAPAGAPRRRLRRALHRHRSSTTPNSSRPRSATAVDAARPPRSRPRPPIPRCNSSSPTCRRSPPTYRSTSRSSPGTGPPTSSSPR